MLVDVLRIKSGELPKSIRGLYDAVTHTIWLDSALTRVERRCTLAHELVHAERRDVRIADPVLNGRQEIVVHREAARRLISVDQLAEAIVWAVEARELAECLDVDLPTLQARLETLNARERGYLEQIARSRQCEEA